MNRPRTLRRVARHVAGTTPIRGVLFDFDGTLTKPFALDFGEIRRAIGCPTKRPILEFIASLSSRARRREAHRILEEFEMAAARRSEPNEGAESIVRFLQSRSLPVGILTRNRLRFVRRTLRNFKYLRSSDFQVILTRDEGFQPKPDPAGILEASRRMQLRPDQILMVGDFIFDVQAGFKAGAATVFLTNSQNLPEPPPEADFVIHRLEELKDIVRLLSPLPMGKLPNDLLQQFLADFEVQDESLLIGPRVGEDTAAVRIAGEEVLILKSDPVTFATDEVGYYAVTINANDVATSGAVPRWMLATLLFPPGTTAAAVRNVFNSLQQVAQRSGLVLCGGHTEVTDAVTRPVVSAHVAGTLPRGGLIDKRSVRTGDRILLTKRLAIEGTCLLARNFPRALERRGLSKREIERCRRLLTSPGISVLPEARLAAESGKVSAMHDITEGGLATALQELSAACGHHLRVYRKHIPILQETRKIARLLAVQPLGLIGSGSLIIVCRQEACEDLKRKISDQGIEATSIGEVVESGFGVEAINNKGGLAQWPDFEVDELARVFDLLQREERNSES